MVNIIFSISENNYGIIVNNIESKINDDIDEMPESDSEAYSIWNNTLPSIQIANSDNAFGLGIKNLEVFLNILIPPEPEPMPEPQPEPEVPPPEPEPMPEPCPQPEPAPYYEAESILTTTATHDGVTMNGSSDGYLQSIEYYDNKLYLLQHDFVSIVNSYSSQNNTSKIIYLDLNTEPYSLTTLASERIRRIFTMYLKT